MGMKEEIVKLRAEVIQLKALVEKQTQMIEKQTQTIEKLTAQLNQNSSNSSKSPSSDDPKARALRRKRKRLSEPKESGGQDGHKGNYRQVLAPEDVDVFVDCIPVICQSCQEFLDGVDVSIQPHLVWDAPPVEIVVTQYNIHRCRCGNCGKKTAGQLPTGISMSQFGPHIQALHTWLRLDMRASIKRTQTFFIDVLGLEISEGTIAAMDKRAAAQLEKFHQQIGVAIQAADIKHCDETGWFENGKKRTLWVAVNNMMSYMLISKNRNTKAAKKLLGEEVQGTIITDRYNAYHWVDNEKRQFCWAHILRDFIGMSEVSGKIGQAGELLRYEAAELLKNYAKSRDGTTEEWEEFVVQIEQKKKYIKNLLTDVGELQEKGKWGGIARALGDYEECMWTFLKNRNVEPTNNLAERTLRHVVIMRKTSFGSNSEKGLRFIERGMSVRQTLILQNRSFFQFLKSLFDGYPQQILPT